jgi:hypothetical protein
MNCQDVETWLLAAARGDATNADAEGAADAQSVSVEARAHVAACPLCAARLRDEQLLSGALRSIAAQDAETAAPAYVETNLLAAFRAQAAASAPATMTARATAPPRTHAPVAPSLPARFSAALFSSPRAFAALAVAAALVLLLVATLRLQSTPNAPTSAPQQANANTPASTAAPSASTAAPSTVTVTPTESVPQQTTTQRDRDERAVVDKTMRTGATSVGRRGFARRGGATRRGEPRGPEAQPVALGEMVVRASAGEPERVTDFVPLVVGDAPPLASGQLVRVELPRSALAALGLTLDPARAGDTIKADVLVGDDGLARAIRFVR